MSNSPQRRVLRWAIRVAVPVGLVALFLLARLADRDGWSLNRPPAVNSPLVGSWVGKHDNRLRFLPDGTIEGSSASWRASGNELSVIYDSPKRLSLAASLDRMFFHDAHTDRYQFQLDGEQLLLTDLSTGDELIFTRQASDFNNEKK